MDGMRGESRAEGEQVGFGQAVRAASPLFLPTLAIGVTFGVLAEPVMGSVAPIVMSVVVFGGAAQFAALSVLAAGGGAATASVAGLLMNARFLPMGFAIAPALRGGRLARAAQGQTLVDASFALANRGEGRFDRTTLFGASLVQAAGWMGGTAIGVVAGARIPAPETFGLDVVFPAFYLALLWPELRSARNRVAAVLGAAIALALLPVAPAGIAVLATSAAALIGLWRPR